MHYSFLCKYSNTTLYATERRTENVLYILCFVDRASMHNLFQMKPTKCTLHLTIFISTSLHVSGNHVPIITRIYCICATLVFFTLCGWRSGLRQPTIQSEKYQCRTETVNFPDDGHIVARNMSKVEINILRSSVHLVGFI